MISKTEGSVSERILRGSLFVIVQNVFVVSYVIATVKYQCCCNEVQGGGDRATKFLKEYSADQ